jgi:phage replication-related protein YjqB (UPF0714/DUF867 family)
MRLPRNYQEVLDAGYVRDQDFRVAVGNLEQVAGCLVTAPHGGGIEPGTSEIARNCKPPRPVRSTPGSKDRHHAFEVANAASVSRRG